MIQLPLADAAGGCWRFRKAGEEGAVKKVLTLLLVVVLGLAALAVVGCGGDTTQAQDYLKAADADYAASQKNTQELEALLTPMLAGAMSGNFAVLTVAGIQQADGIIQQGLADLPGIREQYAKVDSLNGVDDYKQYADAMVKTVDADMAALKGIKSLMDSLTPVVQSGNQAAIAEWFQANSATVVQLQELQSALEKAYSDAQQIKKENNLQY
jgi:hypothetical protein